MKNYEARNELKGFGTPGSAIKWMNWKKKMKWKK